MQKIGIIITRSGSRRVDNFDQVVSIAKEKFPELEFKIFDDQNLPELADAFQMFSGAKIVIAPHGAGLAKSSSRTQEQL